MGCRVLKTGGLITTLALNTSTCQFPLHTSLAFSFQQDAEESSHFSKRESRTLLEGGMKHSVFNNSLRRLDQFSVVLVVLDCKALKAGETLELSILCFKRNESDGNLISY